MILKSLTHKYWPGLFRRMIEYVDQDKGRSNSTNTFTLCHNMWGETTDEVIQKFTSNDHYRRKRTNGVALRHEILSFSPKDAESLDQDKLFDLAHKYLELRQEKGLVFAKLHNQDGHPHIHFLISANEIRSGKSNWKTKTEFEQIKVDLERYQLEKYPELKHSMVKLKNSDRKAELQELVLQSYGQAKDIASFLDHLKRQNLQPYYYREKIRGILDESGQKHTFGKLGIDNPMLENLDRHKELTTFSVQKTDPLSKSRS